MMKLYLFQSGTIRTRRYLLAGGPVTEEPLEVPVPFFLIVHPQGNVLFDTGQALELAGKTLTGNFIPVLMPSDYVTAQLAKIGMKPSDITHVVLSHRHDDHFGGLDAFSGAAGYIQATEFRDEADRRSFCARYPLDWHLLEGDCDLFGDTRVRIVFTPGHTLGHQSLLLKLDRAGEILLAADSAYLEETIERGTLPACPDHAAAVRSLERITKMRQSGVRVITGHDPRTWATLKLAPEFYE